MNSDRYIRPSGGGSRKLVNRCPRCDAAPGHGCGRWSGGAWWTLKTIHKERAALAPRGGS